MSNHYKILMSAYACEPNKGSEPGVGWNWINEVVGRKHLVYVITRENNRNSIENYFKHNEKPTNLEFYYYDIPKYFSFWKKGVNGVHLYYLLWQIGVLFLGIRIHKIHKFDIVHHITFVTIHQPSFLFLLKNVEFFYGPTAGGDVIANRFLKSFAFKDRIKEFLRLIQCKSLIFDPFRTWMFYNSKLIFCNSSSTMNFLPAKVQKKARLSLAIGVDDKLVEKKVICNKDDLKLLFVGNFLYLKGIHLVLNAFNEINSELKIDLTIIGKGYVKELEKFKNDERVKIINWINQEELFDLYKTYDLLLFPSFRDSGGMVVLEAMSKGLPVVCLDLGGPSQIVDNTCGKLISTKNKSEEEIVSEMLNFIYEFYNSHELRTRLSLGSTSRVEMYSWKNNVTKVYRQIEDEMKLN